MHAYMVLISLTLSAAAVSKDGGPCGVELEDISVFPGDAEYHEASQIFNQAFAHIKPAFVALPTTEEEVMRCLQCSSVHSVPCVAKSGGHDYSGYSTINAKDNGFVISLAKMNAISIDPERVEVQAGVKWEDIYQSLSKFNHHQLIVGGMCPVIGMTGYLLGGGMSYLSRKYGLGIDSIVSMRMVMANGSKVVIANETMNPDLFWALRGGGGGNFGIVTEFTIQTHTVTHQNYALVELYFEAGTKSQQAMIVVGQMNLPHEMLLELFVSANKELSIITFYMGSHEEALEYLKPLVDLKGQMDYSNFANYYTLVEALAVNESLLQLSSGNPVLVRGCIFDELGKSVADIMFSLDIPETCMITFIQLGAAVADVPAGETAYFNRPGGFEYVTFCSFTNKENENVVHMFEDQIYYQMNSGGHCLGCYVNTRDKFLHHWRDMYYGGNYPRLVEVQNNWNPAGVGGFHFPQEIG